jgi:transcriptional regulator with XRE-family HTH domain
MRAAALVEALKRTLKAKGLTYADVAGAIALSEASVKRMFARGDFTLQRLEEICRFARIDLAELAASAGEDAHGITQLSVEQEQEIVSDPKLLLVAWCAINNWTFEQIVATYALTDAECIGCLTKLDRIRIIELLPGNRIRPLLSRTFAWRAGRADRALFPLSCRSGIPRQQLRAQRRALPVSERNAFGCVDRRARRRIAARRSRFRSASSRRSRAAVASAFRHEPSHRAASVGAARVLAAATRGKHGRPIRAPLVAPSGHAGQSQSLTPGVAHRATSRRVRLRGAALNGRCSSAGICPRTSKGFPCYAALRAC